MLYLVKMTVKPPTDVDERFERRKADEKQMALRLQREGVWKHLWRVAGKYENYSVFDVPDHDALHALLIGLPLYPWLEMEVTPLAVHPSALEAQDS